MIILDFFCLFLLVILLHLVVSKNLHILQQSFYETDDYLNKIKKSKSYIPKVFDILLFLVMLSSLFLTNISYILSFIYLAILIFAIFCFIKTKKPEKKKFVITNRVKIIYSFYYFILLCIFFILFAFLSLDFSIKIFLSILSLYNTLSILLVIFANILSLPVITILNGRYIKEAKNIIKEHKDLKVIGITGSYGKTSTKNIVARILEEKYSTVMTPQSYNTTLGVTKTIREDIKPYTEVFVCEMGASKLGDVKKICDIVKPDISVITSIGMQHLSTFKKIENIIFEKFQIVKCSKENAKAILNVDNVYIRENYMKYSENREVVKYSLNNSTKYYIENIKMSEQGSTFDAIIDGEKLKIETKLLGKNNLYNILCGIIIAKLLGMENDEITKAIKKIKPVEHRLELKYINGILMLDDSFNSNPEGSKSAIDCLLMFKDKYKVLVTPGMVELGNKEDELNKEFGKYAKNCDYVILVGKNNTKYVKEGLDEVKYKNYIVVDSINEAFEMLTKMKNEGKDLCVLLENDLPDCYL